MSEAIATLLAPGGAVANRLGADFEARPQQVAMAEAVERTLASRGRLLVEAGTGVGKSFAYLLPAIRRALASREAGKRERVVVATNTIALQEQLLEKDVPLLRAALPGEFSAVLVKGRGNYLSIRRLKLASTRQDRLYTDAASLRSLHVIEDWAYSTTDGTLATLPQLERPAVWDRAQSDSGNCMGKRCPTHQQCFFQQARRRMENADLLICNHALFFSDLALRTRGVGFLPKYDHVILDEAHGVEDAATDHFGLSLSEGRVMHLLSLLYQERTQKGFLAHLRTAGDGEDAQRAVRASAAAGAEARLFFERLADEAQRGGGGFAATAASGAPPEAGDEPLFGEGADGADPGASARAEGGSTLRVERPGVVENVMTPAFRSLALSMKRLRDVVEDEQDKFELNAYIERAEGIAVEAEALVEQSMEGCAYWIELKRGGYGVRVTLACSPIDVAPILRERLFEAGCSVVLTSATLTTGQRCFEHIAGRLGVDVDPSEEDAAETIALGSPFHHAEQVEVFVERDMPDPRDARHLASLCERIVHHVRATQGGAFVLFTSHATLGAVDRRVREGLTREGYEVLAQGKDGPRSLILEKFRRAERGVLLGASSFWQGVDVRGRGLRNVIITRLPFEPPDRPLTEARTQRIQERGGQPFMEDALPRAVIRFKQAFGRLIRSAEDEGRVVVLDPRIVTKRYGRQFLSALPEGVPVRG